ncbi:4-amino-4-deoxy-L-arabinose transferase [Pustulibacterium marinum]|uniref:4-amino-4-deoxy-L-arabinose transferase n=1 Tax=Pustulibacterium marinum TaxID=1224947 RepID=A0A1I7F970_9FLAO|nr:phospholipid carrier-dependent glycosyltransferase [Pustulibacterium marinum]SFU32773.1 4-amino-4-deoxy-L-arabinose transferase [Pustulibacterium marinum]
MKILEKYPIAFVSITCLLLFASHLGFIDASIMEARNFIVSREMLTEGHWLLTTMNNIPRYQKPPLPSWIATPFASVLGLNNIIAYRLPTALMATFAVLGCFKLVQSISKNTILGIVSSLIMASSFYVIGIQKEAPTDIYTHGFMLWGIYFLFQFFNKTTFQWKWILLGGLGAAASLLSKGPVSLYALFLPFIIAYAFTYKFENFKTKWWALTVFLLITVILGGWWFIYVKIADPETFTKIAEEETGNWSSYNVRPFYYYWSFFTQSGLWTIPAFFSLLYPIIKKYSSYPKLYKFSWIWTLAVVVLLSIIPEKKSRYLMPVLIPLSINIAMYLEVIFKLGKAKLPKLITIPAYIHFYLIAIISSLIPLAAVYFLIQGQEINWIWFSLTAIGCFFVGIILFRNIRKKNFLKATLLCVGFEVVVMTFGFPLAENFNMNIDYNRISEDYNEKTYIYGNVSPEILWQAHSVAPQLQAKEKLTTTFPAEETFDVFVAPEEVDEFIHKFDPYFKIIKLTTIDLNMGKKKRDRLMSYHYKLYKENE